MMEEITLQGTQKRREEGLHGDAKENRDIFNVNIKWAKN